MILVQAVFFGAGHLAPEYRQLRRRLSAFLHPGNAGSLFFSRSPPKNLEGIMSAAEMGSNEHHSPVAVDSVFMRQIPMAIRFIAMGPERVTQKMKALLASDGLHAQKFCDPACF